MVRDLLFGDYPTLPFDYPLDMRPKSFNAQWLTAGPFTGLIKNIKIHLDSVDDSAISSSQLVNIGLDWEYAEDSLQELPNPLIQRTISFNKEGPDFVRLPAISRGKSLSLTFMFRTSAPTGLIALLSQSGSDGFYLSLSILDGCLHLYASPDLELDTRHLKLRNDEV